MQIELMKPGLGNLVTVSQLFEYMSDNALAQAVIFLKHLNSLALVCAFTVMEVQVSDPFPNP